MSRTLLALCGLLILSVGLVGASAPALSSAPSPAAAQAESGVLLDDPQVIVWNEDHCTITDLIGAWEVRSSSQGTRMRPQHDECYIRILSAVDGLEHEFQVTTDGEVYIAHGWICVNQVDQDSWMPTMVQSFLAGDCDDIPIGCTISYLKDELSQIKYGTSTCWRSVVDPEGCDFVKRCMAGSGGCKVSFYLIDGLINNFETPCGSGSTVKQCTDSYGNVWVCYCE